ncbi:unnamed protein product [Thelazia callipaeda]|uniref:Uncharacterized protein n=1 Tax=Thelazia callipaeda TaxID=103827 RepID=A0A0N5CU66_THECL|nr:unnamed protein product [Thelazia callipaeda]
MLAPIITKDMNLFPVQQRKIQNTRKHAQIKNVTRNTKSARCNDGTITTKKSCNVAVPRGHGNLLKKPISDLVSIVEGVEMCDAMIDTKEKGNIIRGCSALTNSNSSIIIFTTISANQTASNYAIFPDFASPSTSNEKARAKRESTAEQKNEITSVSQNLVKVFRRFCVRSKPKNQKSACSVCDLNLKI